ncbi:MAG: hypothetical protein M1825_005984 [Sarcosagium campestre]|nr:MAG: hypothetical protein M1825_005984 [Sarcosagium campestre]
MPPKRRPQAQPEKKKRLSKLARENDITADEEDEIREAFELFARKGTGEFKSLPPTNNAELKEILSTLDPEESGFVVYTAFVAVCALKLHSRTEASQTAEVESAYQLFTQGTDGPITIAHLRRIARELKENIGDDQLRDMILEANKGSGVANGVRMQDFEAVMQRAGVFK